MKRIKLTEEEKQKRRYERFIEKQSYRGSLGGEAKGEAYLPQRYQVQKLWRTTTLTKKEIAEEVGVSTGFVSKYTSNILRDKYLNECMKNEKEEKEKLIRDLELRTKMLQQELNKYIEKYGDLRQSHVRKKI